MTSAAVQAAVERLELATTAGVPCAPVVDLLGPSDIAVAYEVQSILTQHRLAAGATIVGRKIGLTSEAVQRQIGVDRPDFGVLFDDMSFADDVEIPISRLLQPKAEAEVAFLLASDITDVTDAESVRSAVALAFPALEIVDSRVADWRIGITDTVADNASSGVFVVGSQGLSLDDVEPIEVTMTMMRNGEPVSEGTGRDCLGYLLNALAWLASTAIEFGTPLRAGQLVLSGALGPMVTVMPGDVFTADIKPLGRVTARFSRKDEGMTDKTGVAIVGSGNIGTDLMFKILHGSEVLRVVAMVGIDPASDGLARAARLGVATTARGVAGLMAMPEFAEVEIVLDATSAGAHVANAALLEGSGRRLVDLTPAAIGPFVIPPVNLGEHLDAPNINMVTCGGQATIPIVNAVSRVAPVPYAEIVASVSSKSAGPGTRANIDEFTETTAHAIEQVGGATRGKAIIILNPAEPPLIMRDTVFCLVGDADRDAITASIQQMVEEVATYVPGYRMVQDVQFTPVVRSELSTLVDDDVEVVWKVSVFLEVEGAAHYLPAYAGNLDIMTSAAMRVAERIAGREKVLV